MSFLTNFINKYNNQKVDFDKFYGHQCFDLANQYRYELTGLNPNSGLNLSYAYEAFDEPLGFLNKNTKFEHIDNQPDNCPIPGDIIIWLKSFNGWAGHIAIVTKANLNDFEVLEQNTGSGDGQGDDDRTKLSKYADYAHVAGWLRIKEPNPNTEPTTPTTLNNATINKEYGYKLLASMNETGIIDGNQLNNWLKPRLDVNGAISSIETIIELFQGKDTKISELQEQNAGLARQNTDSSSEKVRLLEARSNAENLTQKKDNLIHELEIKLNHQVEVNNELKTLNKTQSEKLESLTTIVSDKQKIVEKQGEILNSQPKVWSSTEFIIGQLKNGVIPSLAGLSGFVVALISSPEFLDLLQSSKGLALFVPLVPMIIAYLKELTVKK